MKCKFGEYSEENYNVKKLLFWIAHLVVKITNLYMSLKLATKWRKIRNSQLNNF